MPVLPGQACSHPCGHACVAAGSPLLHPPPQRCAWPPAVCLFVQARVLAVGALPRKTIGIQACWAHNRALCWPLSGIGFTRALIRLPAPAGKTLTKQLMTAVESALQDRFGSHAGWAHNTLFISELASQRHVLPAHLHPGARGKAARKGSAAVQDAGAQAEISEPTTPPQLLGRGQRSTARRVSAKRGAAVKPDSKPEAEDAKLPQLCSHDQPSPAAGAAQVLKAEPSDERSNMGEGREGSTAALDILDEAHKVKAEGSAQGALVSELVEVAVMDAFSEVRPTDLSPKTPLAEGERTEEQHVAPKGKRRSKNVRRTD